MESFKHLGSKDPKFEKQMEWMFQPLPTVEKESVLYIWDHKKS